MIDNRSGHEQELIDYPVELFWRGMQLDAKTSAELLDMSWQHPVEAPDLGRERSALRSAIGVYISSEVADDSGMLSELAFQSRDEAASESLYEVQAAVRLIPDLVPFRAVQSARDARKAATGGDLIAAAVPASRLEEEAFGQWHRWLWHSAQGDIQAGRFGHGNSTLFRIAVGRLEANLRAIYDS